MGKQSTGIGTYTLSGSGGLTLADNNAEIILGSAAGSLGTFNYDTTSGDLGSISFDGTGQQIIVGLNGTANFFHGGRDLNLAASGVSLDIAANAGSAGAYYLSGGGTLETFGGLKVGDGGAGVFNLSGVGSSATINGDLVMGSQSGASGQFNISGGTLNVTGGLTVGDAGTGQYNQSGGAATIDGNLIVGKQANAIGSFISISGTLSNPPSLTVDGSAQIGMGANGSFAMAEGGGYAGTVDIKGSMTFGTVGGGAGGGAIENGSLTIGDGGSGNELLINAGSGIKIEDFGGLGAQVTVDGDVLNNGIFELGLHTGIATPATLTVTGTLTNNNSFNLEGNAVLNANVVNTNFFTAQNGASTDVTLNGNVDNSGTFNLGSQGKMPATMAMNGNFTNEAAGTLTVTGSNLTLIGSGAALDNYGTVNISEDVNGHAAPLSDVKITGNVTNEKKGSISITDSTVKVTGALDNFGSITATSVARDGLDTAVSNVTVTKTLTNENGAALTVSGASTFSVGGAATNNGTINIQASTANWNGGLTNNGAYHSDPGSFNVFVDLNNGPNGYLTGAAGDIFKVTGNFASTSTQSASWDTGAATLQYSGPNNTRIRCS